MRRGGRCQKALIPRAHLWCWLLAQRHQRLLRPFIHQASFFKAALLFEQHQQAVQRILVRGKAREMLFQDLFCQTDLPLLKVQIRQVAYHATTGHAKCLLPQFDPAVPYPLAPLVVGQKLTAQQGLRLLPERKCLIWHSHPDRLRSQVFKGIRINPQARLLGQREDYVIVVIFKEFLAVGSAQDLVYGLPSS